MSRRFAALLAALTCSTVVATAPLSAQNLVTNGGAESGLTGWTPDAGVCGQTTGVTVNTTAAHTGTSSFQIVSTPDCFSWITQPMTLVAGHSYQVDFWYEMLGEIPPGTSISDADEAGYQFSNFGGSNVFGVTPEQGWQHITHLPLPAPTDTTTLKVGGFENFGSILIDDVSVVDVTTTPEPSSLALLGTGLVGLVPMVRRRVHH